MTCTVRECAAPDVPLIVGYFLDADPEFLRLLGADPAKLPGRQQWIDTLLEQLERPLQAKERYYLVWEVDGSAVGHSNLTEIDFGKTANMHLHLWSGTRRQRGHGTALAAASIDRYFALFELYALGCEPHAENPAPNRALPRLGFEYVERYFGLPGSICYPQHVHRWRLTRPRWEEHRRSGSTPLAS